MKKNKKIKNKRFKTSNIILLGVFVLLLIVSPSAYGIYQSRYQVNVVTKTGEIIYDLKVDSNDIYVEGNQKYFLILVNNFKMDGNTKYLNSVPCNYVLTVKNKDTGADGLFKYLSEKDGETSGDTFLDTVTYNGKLGTTEETQRIKVYVDSKTNLKTNVDYVVTIDVVQGVVS